MGSQARELEHQPCTKIIGTSALRANAGAGLHAQAAAIVNSRKSLRMATPLRQRSCAPHVNGKRADLDYLKKERNISLNDFHQTIELNSTHQSECASYDFDVT